jgi:hypothetical protein
MTTLDTLMAEYEAFETQAAERLAALRSSEAPEAHKKAERAVLLALLNRRKAEHQTLRSLYLAAEGVAECARRVQARIDGEGRGADVSRFGELRGHAAEMDRLSAILAEERQAVGDLEAVLDALANGNTGEKVA